MNTPLDLVIFDCDGVLIDSERLASRTLAEALTELGAPTTAEAALRAHTGKSEPEIRAVFAATGTPDPEAGFARWQARLFEAFSRELEPLPGIEALLGGLATRYCVASNSTHLRLGASLGRTALAPLVEGVVFSAEDVARPKPAPDLLHLCLDRFGARAQASVMVDDSPHGIHAAKAAGVRAIGFIDPADPRPDRARRLTEAGADHVATGVGELAPLLGIF